MLNVRPSLCVVAPFAVFCRLTVVLKDTRTKQRLEKNKKLYFFFQSSVLFICCCCCCFLFSFVDFFFFFGLRLVWIYLLNCCYCLPGAIECQVWYGHMLRISPCSKGLPSGQAGKSKVWWVLSLLFRDEEIDLTETEVTEPDLKMVK